MTGARLSRALAGVALGAALCGCASITMPPAAAGPDAVMSLRAANAPPATTGTFAIAPGQPASMDGSVSGLRGSSMQPPGGSFSRYLADVIVADLKSSGLHDPASTIVISGDLTDSQVDAAIGTGTARLGARLKVSKTGVTVHDKALSVSDQWDASFMGAVAIPEAMNRYNALYQKLAQKLFDDPDFRRAVAR